MIKLVGISKIYNNSGVLTTGLHNVSIELNQGEIVAITGESGSGKSTLLNVLTKMDTFDEGEYYFKGNETSYFDVNDMDNFRKNKVGFIFQNYNIIESLSVFENVILPLKINGVDLKTASRKANELIEKVGLSHRKNQKGAKLSGGEKQRCVIARALASNCEILACDEPTGNLDSKSGEEIISLIKEVAKDKLVLIVTHNYEQVKDIVTRKITVHNGEIIEDLIFDEVEKDADVEMNLDYQPLKNNIRFDIAKSSLISTPKKTIFSFLVFMFVAVFALSLYQSIFYTRQNAFYQNNFVYKGSEKYMVYNINDDHLIDLEKIKQVTDKYSVNNFYDDKCLTIQFLDGDGYYFSVGYEKYPSNLKIDYGRNSILDDECVLLVPSSYENASIFLNKEFIFNESSISGEEYIFKIVGYSYRDDITCLMLTNCNKCEKIFKAFGVLRSIEVEIRNENDDIFYSSISCVYNPDLERSYFMFSDYYADDISNITSVDFTLYSLYHYNVDISKLDFLVSSDCYSVVFYAGNDFIDLIDEKPYEISVYITDGSDSVKTIQNFGYDCVSVIKFTNENNFAHLIFNITLYVSILLSSVILIIIYFISYMVLSKIYMSKNKDFTILRTLGITKKDMSKIVQYEVLFQTILSSMLVFALMLFVRLFVKTGLFQIFSSISIFASILYFVVIILFGLLLAKRLNYKIFKFSVNTSLKDGEAKND